MKAKVLRIAGDWCVAGAFASLCFYTDIIKHDLVIVGIASVLFILGFTLKIKSKEI